jgi:hypothetical protein
MRPFKRMLVLLVAILFMMGGIYSSGWCWEKWKNNDPTTDEWVMLDILIARPLGIAAGIIGSGVLVLSLPFTIPTNGVNKAADILVKRPFQFSFSRECPDEDM